MTISSSAALMWLMLNFCRDLLTALQVAWLWQQNKLHIVFTGQGRDQMLVPHLSIRSVRVWICVLQRCCPGSHRACMSRRRWRPPRSSARRRMNRPAGRRSPPRRGAPSRCKSLWPGTAQVLGDTKQVDMVKSQLNTPLHTTTRLKCSRSSTYFWFKYWSIAVTK